MKNPGLLYASPFPPMASGISDYSTVLVKALADNFDITLYTDDYAITEPSMAALPVLRNGVDEVRFASFDHILYNMGNNADYHGYIYKAALSHPGVVILHDMVLFHFIYLYYREQENLFYTKLYKDFSLEEFTSMKEAVKDGLVNLELASELPLNTELLRSGNRFIVHSEYARNQILSSGEVEPSRIIHINMFDQVEEGEGLTGKEELLGKYGIDPDALLICSFGYIQGTKMNLETIRAVKRLAKVLSKKICYVMVGQGDYADRELVPGLAVKTGYTGLKEFNSFARHADIVVNLRYPSMGETSAAMLRCMKMGRPVITNNGGWFTEVPDSCVKKIVLDHTGGNLEKALKELILDEGERKELGERAAAYVEGECSLGVISQEICDFVMGK